MSLFYYVNATLCLAPDTLEVAVWISENMPFTDGSEEQLSRKHPDFDLGVVDGCFCFTISTANEDRW